MSVDVNARLQQLEDLVNEAPSMPLSSNARVNREEILELIHAVRAELPEELKQARWILKDREELLAKARKEGEAIVERAHQERDRIVSQEEVVRVAQERVERMLGEAREHARQIRLEAEDYVDGKLAQFEIALERTQAEIERSLASARRGREKLRGLSPAQEEFGSDEAATGSEV